MKELVLKTKLCEALNIVYPIMCAGMGQVIEGRTVTTGRLAGEVSKAGGLGVIGASALTGPELREQIRELKSITDKPFGVDIMFPALATYEGSISDIKASLPKEHLDFVEELKKDFGIPDIKAPEIDMFLHETSREQFEVTLEEKVPILACGLGTPEWVVARAHQQGMTVMSLVGNVRDARRVAERKVDIILAQGYEAGGHTGKIANFVLIPEVVDAVYPIPVVAAGGIVDGRGVAASFALGALGVWIGTAFLATEESGLPHAHKLRILEATSKDAQITRAVTGKTTRDLTSPILEAWDKASISPLPMPHQSALMMDLIYGIEEAQKWELSIIPAGQGVGEIKEIKPAGQLVKEIVEGAIRILAKKLLAEVTAKGS